MRREEVHLVGAVGRAGDPGRACGRPVQAQLGFDPGARRVEDGVQNDLHQLAQRVGVGTGGSAIRAGASSSRWAASCTSSESGTS